MATPLWLLKLDEASSGTAPTSILDSSTGTAVNATPTYGTGAAWASIGAGKGLSTGTHVGNDTTGTVIRTGALGGTKLAAPLTATKTFSWEMVINVPAGGATTGGLVLEISDWATGQAIGGIYKAINAHTWEVYDNVGTLCYTLAMPTAGTTTVVHFVVDTAQATVGNRFKAYFDGVAQTLTTIGAGFALNLTYTVGASDAIMIFGGPPSGSPIDWVTTGTLYYIALYSSVLTAGEITANAAALAINNDADPNGGTPATTVAKVYGPAKSFLASFDEYENRVRSRRIASSSPSAQAAVAPAKIWGLRRSWLYETEDSVPVIIRSQPFTGFVLDGVVVSTVALSIESDFTVAATVTETDTSSISFNVTADFSVAASVTETISSTSAFAITSDFAVAASVDSTTSITGTIAATIDQDFSASSVVTETINQAIAASIESDFSVASTATESLGLTSAVSIEGDFSVASSALESIPSAVSAEITSDFSSAVSGTVNNPGSGAIALAIESDFTVESAVTETIPGTSAVAITSDFTVASAVSERVDLVSAFAITSDFESSATGTVANPVSGTGAVVITDDLSVALTGTSISGGDLTAAVVITNDFTVASFATETIPGSASVSIASDITVGSTGIVANPVTSTAEFAITNDIIVAAISDSNQSVTSTSATSITGDFEVQSLFTVTEESFVTVDITDNFSVLSSFTESYDAPVSLSIGNDFSVLSNVSVFQNVDALITIDLASLFSSRIFLLVSNPNIPTGTIVEAIWLPSTAPQAKWL